MVCIIPRPPPNPTIGEDARVAPRFYRVRAHVLPQLLRAGPDRRADALAHPRLGGVDLSGHALPDPLLVRLEGLAPPRVHADTLATGRDAVKRGLVETLSQRMTRGVEREVQEVTQARAG
jgi:hypothetical protein